MIKFSDWLITAKESSAFTRLRWNAAMGLAPPIPDASMHSRSTASPWMVEKKTKKKKKKKKSKKKNESIEESKKITPVKHGEIDNWLGEVDKLKAALGALKDVISKKKKEPKADDKAKTDDKKKVDDKLKPDEKTKPEKSDKKEDEEKLKISNTNDRNNSARPKDSQDKPEINKKAGPNRSGGGSNFKK